MQYIVALNGPPKVGKDTLATMLRHLMDQECNIPTHLDHLARPMREMAMSLVGVNPQDFGLYNEIKDKPQSLLKTALRGDFDSIRKLMIRTSEDFIKPTYGPDFWGRKLVSDHKWFALGYPGVLIVPDLGFKAEGDVFESTATTLFVQVDREGTTWEGDSRGPVSGVNTFHVFNNGTPFDAALAILNQMRRLGWNLSCGA